jgi:hypothetical protein
VAPETELPGVVEAAHPRPGSGLEPSQCQQCGAFICGEHDNRRGVTGSLRLAPCLGEQPESVLDLPTLERLDGEQALDARYQRRCTGRLGDLEPAIERRQKLLLVSAPTFYQEEERVLEPSRGVLGRWRTAFVEPQRLLDQG